MIDASGMPDIPRANTNATTIMIEERAVDFMLCVQAFENVVSSHLRLQTRCKTKIGRFQTVPKLLALEVYPESGRCHSKGAYG